MQFNLKKMKNNADLQKDVQDAIRWEPLLNAAEIGVTVKEGIVTLTGVVDSYAKKLEVEHAAKNVAGVNALVEKLEVKFSSIYGKRDDNQLASEIISVFKSNWRIPNEKVKVKVEKGWVTLEGELDWFYEKEATNDAVKNLLGVIGVTNNMRIESELGEASEKEDIESALRRNWSIPENDITVKLHGHKATLTGTVDSWYQKNEAGKIAANAKGIWTVENDLVIEYQHELLA